MSKRSYWASESDEKLQAALTEYVEKRDTLNGELDECIDSLRDELFTRTQERYADQRAHNVTWMTADEREGYDRQVAELDTQIKAKAGSMADHFMVVKVIGR